MLSIFWGGVLGDLIIDRLRWSAAGLAGGTTWLWLGGVAGVLTGLLDAVVVAGFPQGYEDLAPLPVILAEAGAMVTDLSGGLVLTGPGTALISTSHQDAELLTLVAGLPHGQRKS